MQNAFQELMTPMFGFLYEAVSISAKFMLKREEVSREKLMWLFRNDRVEINMDG